MMDSRTPPQPPSLARRVGLPQLTFYGLGTVLGAGIYVLVGKVAAAAGMLAPLAFLAAALVASVTAMSYSQMVVLFPRSAGEAAYADAAFHRLWLTRLTGLLIIFTGIVSAATLSVGFVGYINEFVPLSRSFGVVIVVVLLGALACRGIAESMWILAVSTLIEVGGLLLVIVYGGDLLVEAPARLSEFMVPSSMGEVIGVAAGAFLAFYAFIGFEDMVNVVEEVKNPGRDMPRAILIVVMVSVLMYFLVTLIALLALPLDELQRSDAPLADVLRSRSNMAAKWVAGISVLAILNGVLAQIIMTSRVLYGMASQKQVPAWFAHVNAYTRTPIVATLVVVVLIFIAAMLLPLTTLARATSFIVLIVFTIVNLSLWRISRIAQYREQMTLPHYPRVGALLCLALLLVQIFSN